MSRTAEDILLRIVKAQDVISKICGPEDMGFDYDFAPHIKASVELGSAIGEAAEFLGYEWEAD